MHSLGERNLPRVVRHVRPLPIFPFRGATAAVSRFAHLAPHAKLRLQPHCNITVDSFTAEEVQRFCNAALRLHPRHQLPYVLSRVAASKAIETVLNKPEHEGKNGVVFTGSRHSAAALHGCELSLSHEEDLGAAVAWVPNAQLSNLFNTTTAGGTKPSFGDQPSPGVAAAAQSEGQRGNRFVCAIDACPVAEVHRVRCRFPRLGQRWMPQCDTDAPAHIIHDALDAIEVQSKAQLMQGKEGFTYTDGEKDDDGFADAGLRRREWWRRMAHPCLNESEAYAALVLAQHWGARECAIKLLGVSERSFSYGCLQRDAESTVETVGNLALPFTTSFFLPHTLYRGVISDPERVVWQHEGLEPMVYLYSWVEWCRHTETADMPYVIVVACCSTVRPTLALRK